MTAVPASPVRRLLSVAARGRRALRVRIFGNDRSAWVNGLHAAHHWQARRRLRRAAAPTDPIAASLAAMGFATLPAPPGATALAARAAGLLNDLRASVATPALGLVRLRDCVVSMPEFTSVMTPDLERGIEANFGSHFQVYAADVYRLVPVLKSDEGSFLWHFDNWPRQALKLLVYLSDVDADTGAFSLKSLASSNALKRAGYWDRRRAPEYSAALAGESGTHRFIGGIGTRILFANGRCLHKATHPRRAARDILALNLIPSLRPWRESFERDRGVIGRRSGACLNPWTGRAAGDE